MSDLPRPNLLAVAWSILQAQRVARPAPTGPGRVDHSALAPILSELRDGGVAALPGLRGELARYRTHLERIDPDTLSRDEAVAYWMNLYNAGALDLAAESAASQEGSVLRVPGGFRRRWAIVCGEELSLDAIEHGKLRRFGDPRIHGALVCGSASCPTLRVEPYSGTDVDHQLDDQMRAFLAGGGAVADRSSGVLHLSRIFLWYGADYVRPHRMPTWLPAARRSIARALLPWVDGDTRDWLDDADPAIAFQPYDWSLACAIR